MEPNENLPYNQDVVDRQILKYLKLMNLHRELSGYYRSRSKDRRSISNLWYHIDGLELDLRAEGVDI